MGSVPTLPHKEGTHLTLDKFHHVSPHQHSMGGMPSSVRAAAMASLESAAEQGEDISMGGAHPQSKGHEEEQGRGEQEQPGKNKKGKGKRKAREEESASAAPKKRVPPSTTAEDTQKLKEIEGSLKEDIQLPTARKSIPLDIQSILSGEKRSARYQIAPMVWSLRGRLAKKFYYLLKRNRDERFWTDEQAKAMAHDRNLEAVYKTFDAAELFNADGKRRKRAPKQLMDEFEPETGRFKAAKDTLEARKISETAANALVFEQNKKGKGKEKEKQGLKRVKAARSQLSKVAGLTLETKAKISHYADIMVKEFNKEHENLYEALRLLDTQVENFTGEKDFLERQVHELEKDVARVDTFLSKREETAPESTQALVGDGHPRSPPATAMSPTTSDLSSTIRTPPLITNARPAEITKY
ncbi:MAG: hypothetical protein Q9184_003084, partial [Pyrenodesmia sp. 2 TL-2023]